MWPFTAARDTTPSDKPVDSTIESIVDKTLLPEVKELKDVNDAMKMDPNATDMEKHRARQRALIMSQYGPG